MEMVQERIVQDNNNDEETINSDEISTSSSSSSNHPFDKLIERQAKQFEEFGKKMSLQLKTTFQEFINQRDETLDENSTFVEKYQKQIDAQSELIGYLTTRIENLEIYSNKKVQDIKNLRQDFNFLLQLHNNKKETTTTTNLLSENPTSTTFSSQINFPDQIHTKVQEIIKRRLGMGKKAKGKHFKILGQDFKSYELIQYVRSRYFNSLNDYTKSIINNVINKVLSERLKFTNNNSDLEGDASDKTIENTFDNAWISSFILDQIHNSIQEIINQRERIGKEVRQKDLKILKRTFTSDDLIRYINSEDFDSLKAKVKKFINNIMNLRSKVKIESSWRENNMENITNYEEEASSNLRDDAENENFATSSKNQGNNSLIELHLTIRQIEESGFKLKLKTFKELEKFFTIDDFIEYVKTNQFNSLNK